MMKPIIEIKNLSAGYDGHTVLHDVNLSIYERDFLGIIGPNGGGKTTLIKCILGLLKPTGGEIIFHTPEKAPIRTSTEGTSTETSAKSSFQSSSAKSQLFLGYLPQYSTIDRKFPISVEEVILSGQLQRALLGRAIISDPAVLILDEPSTYIDKRFEARLYELLAEINKECAIILVSHDIGTVLQQVKSIACVNETLDYHPDTGVTTEWLERNFNCPIELLGHGTLPHRVLGEHHHHH